MGDSVSNIGNRKRRPFSSTKKTMICNKYQTYVNAAPNTSNNYICKTVASSMDWTSVCSVMRGKGTGGVISKSKMKKNSRLSITDKINDSTKCAIKNIVHQFFLRSEDPTVNKILKAVNNDGSLGTYTRSKLCNILRGIGFKFNERVRYSLLTDMTVERTRDMFVMGLSTDLKNPDSKGMLENQQEDKSRSIEEQKSPLAEASSGETQDEEETPIGNDEAWKTEGSGFICNECKLCISGVRYKCVQCSDYDVCAACEARGVHALHYALRVPEHSAQHEVLRVTEAIRKCLNEKSFIAPKFEKGMQMVPYIKKVMEELPDIKQELIEVEENKIIHDVGECHPLIVCEEQQRSEHIAPKHDEIFAAEQESNTASAHFTHNKVGSTDSQFGNCSYQTLNLASPPDHIYKKPSQTLAKRLISSETQPKITPEVSLLKHLLLMGKSSPTINVSSLSQPLKINFEKIAMRSEDPSNSGIG